MAVVKKLTVAYCMVLLVLSGAVHGGRFGLLGGQVAPIEVIEEWGCYDTEIRLTCGNLESRVAILEAKFTPRCADERAEDCVHVDEISMTRSFSSQKVDRLALEEKEAGQRFLQTLRRAHEHEKESVPSVGAVHSGEAADVATTSRVRTRVKDKRSSLRATLEHLIERYLRRLTGSGEEDEEEGGHESTSMRYRRQVSGYDGNGTENATELVATGNEGPDSSVEITLLTNDTEVVAGNDSVAVWGYSVTPTAGESAVESVNSQSTVTAESEKNSRMVNDDDGDGDSDEERVRDEQEDYGAPKAAGHKKKVCNSIRKRIAQLDRFELQKSLRNDSFREYNIRNALNYRCSGKNHCSFVFAQDHPYAVVWKEGTVRVKYICMDDFRISKYCEEHLIIGSENRWDRRRNNPRSSSSSSTVERDISGGNDPHHPAKSANLKLNDDGVPAGFTDDREEYAEYEYDDRDEEETEEEEEQEQEERDREQDYVDDGPRGEPRAEALQQQPMPQPMPQTSQQQQQMHSFHNLKILKTLPGPDSDDEGEAAAAAAEVTLNETEKERLHQAEAEAANRKRQRQKVFSQDFRVLKILPSNLDQIEDIKRIGNEYYFKKDVEVVDDAENEIVPPSGTTLKNDTATNNNQFTETLDIVVLPAAPTTKDADVYESDLDLPLDAGKTTVNVIELITPTMITGQETIHSTIGTNQTASTVASSSTTQGPRSSTDDDTLERYPVESNEIEDENLKSTTSKSATGSAEDSFSFNNRTFRKMQDTVREEIGTGAGDGGNSEERYPGSYDDDSDDDELEDEDEEDYEESERRGHKKYISIQRTLLKHPLRQGFLMTPGYPKYYIGNSVCRWTLYAKRSQKIKLTILDLALRLDEPCRDYLEIRDLNTNQTLFSGCTESTRPIEVVSLQDRVEVSLRTATQVAYPKRGVLIHYSALGCEPPSPIPPHMTLVRRSERRVRYVCDPLYVFPDTAEPSRELVCTAKHTWNRPLPACVEKRATEGSGLVSHYEQKRKISDSDSMSDKQADTVYDILIPSLVIAALFIVNGIVFAVIMRYRNKRKQRLELDSKELAEL